MFEMLCMFAAELPRHRPLRVFCNAELPGAFITAVIAWCRTETARRLRQSNPRPADPAPDWVASSYEPGAAAAGGNRTILGDRYGFLRANPRRWFIGEHSALPAGTPPITGDVTEERTQRVLAAALCARWPGSPDDADTAGADLYTSDAGIDVTADYSTQEAQTLAINAGQVLCGLQTLARGGMLVTKQYTFLLQQNRALIALLTPLFDSFRVVKPLTSRPANSELYLVGTGYRGRAAAAAVIADIQRSFAERTPITSPDLAIYDPVLLAVAVRLASKQISYLREVPSMLVRLRDSSLETLVAPKRAAAIAAWLKKYPLARLDRSWMLAPPQNKK
jgi:hypothetical protein